MVKFRKFLCIFFMCNCFCTPLFAAGKTPGMTSTTDIQANTVIGQFDFFITPETEPGPNSHVFWANQLNSLKAYTGLQSNVISSKEGQGKQFLFSMWGATDARPGTPASTGIGGGSYCTTSPSAVDDQEGAQCRYLFNWLVGHTYRFRVIPDYQRGKGWYKSSVSDMTPGYEKVTFDIGSLYKSTGSGQVIPAGDIIQWVEYLDWNDGATTCLSVAHTEATFSLNAFDLMNHKITLPEPRIGINDACPASSSLVTQNHFNVHMVGGPKQSAEGFIQHQGNCLLSSMGHSPQSVIAGPCPTNALIVQNGGDNYEHYFWVLASDKTIQQKSNKCLSAKGDDAPPPEVENCVPGEPAQQWEIAPTGQIKSVFSGKCLTFETSGLTGLEDCLQGVEKWTLPGKTFMNGLPSGR